MSEAIVCNLRQNCTTTAWMRWGVVLLLTGALAGGYMLLYALSPLQTMLSEENGWTLMAYSRYSSAESFLNVFCGILLVAGLLIDRLGVRRCGLLSASLMLAGGFINYYALTPAFATSGINDWLNNNLNLPDSWWNITPFCTGMASSAKLSALGFMVFGIGIEMAGVAASRGTVRWFKGKELAMAMGVQLAGARIMVAIALWCSPRIAMLGNVNSTSRPLLAALLALVAGILCWIAYSVLDCRTKSDNPEAIKHIEKQPGNENGCLTKLLHPLSQLLHNTVSNRILWLLAFICVAYYASVIPFYRYATAIFQSTLGIQASGAASMIAILPLVSALATPFVGMIPDFKGGALWLMAIGSVSIICVYFIFGYILPQYPVLWIAYAGIALLGIASALVSAGLWPLLPRVAPDSSLGSAYAAFYWVQAIGLYLTPIGVAAAMGNVSTNTYTPALSLFGALAACAVIATAVLAVINKNLGLGLNRPNRITTTQISDM